MNKTISYGKQWVDEEDINAVMDVLRGDWLTQGPVIEHFEAAVAEYTNTRYAVAFNSGTSALHAAMSVAGVEKNKEVITSPITFVATSNSAIYCGGVPKFVDIDPNTYCIDVGKLADSVNNQTRVIAPVDFAGYPVDMKAVKDLAEDNDIFVIEDAAHALGAKYKGNIVGPEADMTMFSFHPVKHITTGEGGIIVTNNEEYAEELKLFRSHGITKDPVSLSRKDVGPWYYEMQSLGYNNRITDIQCALGLSQLSKLEFFIKRRNEIAKKYDQAFLDHPNIVIPPKPSESSRHAYHIYPVVLNGVSRKEIYMKLREKGIFCQVHYIPVHLQPYYREMYGYKEEMFPEAENYYEDEITIPLYPKMTDDEVNYVIDTFIDVVNEVAILNV